MKSGNSSQGSFWEFHGSFSKGMNLINLLSINHIFSETISYQPESPTSEGQASDSMESPTKKRILVDQVKRIKLTEYFYSHQGKVSPKEASQLFSIGFENCRKLLRKLHRGESITEKPAKKKHATKLLPEHHAFIDKLIMENPKISNQAIANILSSLKVNPIRVSRSTIRRHRKQSVCSEESNPLDGSTEEFPFDNQVFEPDSLTLDFKTTNEYDEYSLFSLPLSLSMEELL